jgi:hypothetical protein
LVFAREHSKDVIITGHDITNIQMDHAFPVFILMIILVIVIVLILLRYIRDNYVFTSSQEEELLSIEELFSYYSSLYKTDIEYWIKEEMQIRKQYGYKKMKDVSFSLMRIANISYLGNKKRHDKMVEQKGISNVVSYDLLAQTKYRGML